MERLQALKNPVIAGPRPGETVQKLRDYSKEFNNKPFGSDEPMQGLLSTSLADFHDPLLRRTSLSSQWTWESKIAAGAEGVVWKISIEGKSYAIKVFWDNQPSEDGENYPVRKECHNAALLQMMQSVVASAAERVYLNPNPQTRKDAMRNLQAFSDEGRQRARFAKFPRRKVCEEVPRFRQCFGWTVITPKIMSQIPFGMKPEVERFKWVKRWFAPDDDYFAIIYEYIPPSDNKEHIPLMLSQLQFYWLVGFSTIPDWDENWTGGILLDFGDLSNPWEPCWRMSRYHKYVKADLDEDLEAEGI